MPEYRPYVPGQSLQPAPTPSGGWVGKLLFASLLLIVLSGVVVGTVYTVREVIGPMAFAQAVQAQRQARAPQAQAQAIPGGTPREPAHLGPDCPMQFVDVAQKLDMCIRDFSVNPDGGRLQYVTLPDGGSWWRHTR